ncbi:MAG TPA: hypothetical protein VFY41_01955 [Nitrososphaeraceae archaeon]|nr:hypothetical protein [Nitrososphaeraceae archaeon]
MRYICPRVFNFELTDEEIEMERRKAESLYGIYNPITKERKSVKRVIPDLTEKLWPA